MPKENKNSKSYTQNYSKKWETEKELKGLYSILFLCIILDNSL